MNYLYYGDNLDVLRRHVKDDTVDLVYLDPPFNSNQDYNVLFAEHGTRSAAQIHAFEDTWRWDKGAAAAYEEMVERGGKVSEVMQAFMTFLGHSDMMAYLCMMAPRLAELRRVLKTSGSIWLHCDPTAGHYLKMLMDAIFGPVHFRNEIVWQRSMPKGHAFTRFPVAQDTILYYGKSDAVRWNPTYLLHRAEYIDSHYSRVDEAGRHYMLDNCLNPNPNRPNLTYEWHGHTRVWRWTKEKMQAYHDAGRLVYTKSGMPRYKRYLDEMPGRPVTSVWTDIPPINSQAKERLGYPTQKPEALLERIVSASSNEGDTILDPFCGCGTAVAVAQRLNRRWIGIDITHLAVYLIKRRLRESFGPGIEETYQVLGEPTDLQGAATLAESDPYQFQWWALGLVHARPAEGKKGADKGIDGRLYFHDEKQSAGRTKQIILSVKAGTATAAHVRDLRGVLDREKADIGVLVSLQEPTREMKKEAASAGFYTSPFSGGKHARLQLLTIAALLDGEGIDYPTLRANVTFKQAPRAEAMQAAEPAPLPFDGPAATGSVTRKKKRRSE